MPILNQHALALVYDYVLVIGRRFILCFSLFILFFYSFSLPSLSYDPFSSKKRKVYI